LSGDGMPAAMRRAAALLLAAALGVAMLSSASAGEPAGVPALRDDESLSAARLSAAEIDEIIGEVEATSFDTAEDWPGELRARRLRLGDSDGLVVRGTRLLCGGTGNCQTWLFRRVEGRWRGLFADQAPVGEGIAFTGDSHGGLPDAVIDAHLSASESDRTVFAFDGSFYRAAKCFAVANEAGQERTAPAACR
jgi:hypothetical protein